jgi:hypothetical protein
VRWAERWLLHARDGASSAKERSNWAVVQRRGGLDEIRLAPYGDVFSEMWRRVEKALEERERRARKPPPPPPMRLGEMLARLGPHGQQRQQRGRWRGQGRVHCDILPRGGMGNYLDLGDLAPGSTRIVIGSESETGEWGPAPESDGYERRVYMGSGNDGYWVSCRFD